jgi:tyrosyl-tRNA synthetase
MEKQTKLQQEAAAQARMIMKGAQQVIQESELLEKLENSLTTGKPLTVKLGLDPSAPDIHLGHAVVLRKIRQIQDLGHQAVIVIGDFTGRIGDPTGRSKTRKVLTAGQVQENAKTYAQQIFKIIDRDKTRLCMNHEWLAKLDFEAVLKLAGQVTVARMLERDSFADRFARNEPIGLHEFFYPLMQAYDSVHLEADIELGGTDQTFNILMGRTLQKNVGQPCQIALLMPLLEGTDGVEKMSKSLDNTIGIDEEAAIQFRKVMSIPDALIVRYAELATDWHPDQIDDLRRRLADPATNPRNVKIELAREITRLYHQESGAAAAEQHFLTVYQQKRLPDQMPELVCPRSCLTLEGQLELPALLAAAHLAASKSDARRLIQQKGVRIDGMVIDQLVWTTDATSLILQAGKDHFCKIWLNDRQNG